MRGRSWFSSLYSRSPRSRTPRIGRCRSWCTRTGGTPCWSTARRFWCSGAQVNNSSAWPGVLPQVWPAIKAIHANTVEMPVYWEQFEPKPGVFDYSVVDALITQSPQERRPPDPAVVRDVEERRSALHAAVDEAGSGEVPADARRQRAHGGLGVAVLARDAGSRQACVRRADAPPQEVRPAAHGDHGAGGERARHLGRDPRLLAGGDEGVRESGAGAGARRDEQEARQPDRRLERRVRQGRGRIFPCLGAWPRSSARSPRRARRSTRCRCTRTPRSAIRSRRGRPAATRAAGPPTTCCRSGRPSRPRSTSWRPTST